ncbi:MAG: substrate-binding domain-containing protein [Nocardioides sp.]
MVRIGRRVAALCGTALVGMALVSCGNSESSADASASTGTSGKEGEQVVVGLITKTNTNPYYIAMLEGAREEASNLGYKLLEGSGQSTTDISGQITAMQNMISAGASGILVSSSDSKALLPTIQQARDKGILVIAVDAPVTPADAVDALFATDNFEAGQVIGQWAAASMKDQELKIAMLDDQPGSGAGVLRHNGFLAGLGADVSASDTELADDPRIVCSGDTSGDQTKGQSVMESCLQKDPDINLVYSINEPAGLGAAKALATAKKSNVPIVSVDGGCTGVKGVESGELSATAQQYPLKMAVDGLRAVSQFLEDGTKPAAYVNTGVNLITAEPASGVDSKPVSFGLDNCWG